MNKPLSNNEVLKLANSLGELDPKKIKFYTYNELKNVSYPEESGAYVILYRENENYGHYVGLIHRPDGILEFFDGYGLKPDSEKKWYTKEMNEKLDQLKPYLGDIMRSYLDQKKDSLEFNEYAFQDEDDENNQTCGRHVGLRIALMKLPLYEYAELIEEMCENLDIDSSELVVLITDELLGSKKEGGVRKKKRITKKISKKDNVSKLLLEILSRIRKTKKTTVPDKKKTVTEEISKAMKTNYPRGRQARITVVQSKNQELENENNRKIKEFDDQIKEKKDELKKQEEDFKIHFKKIEDNFKKQEEIIKEKLTQQEKAVKEKMEKLENDLKQKAENIHKQKGKLDTSNIELKRKYEDDIILMNKKLKEHNEKLIKYSKDEHDKLYNEYLQKNEQLRNEYEGLKVSLENTIRFLNDEKIKTEDDNIRAHHVYINALKQRELDEQIKLNDRILDYTRESRNDRSPRENADLLRKIMELEIITKRKFDEQIEFNEKMIRHSQIPHMSPETMNNLRRNRQHLRDQEERIQNEAHRELQENYSGEIQNATVRELAENQNEEINKMTNQYNVLKNNYSTDNYFNLVADIEKRRNETIHLEYVLSQKENLSKKEMDHLEDLQTATEYYNKLLEKTVELFRKSKEGPDYIQNFYNICVNDLNKLNQNYSDKLYKQTLDHLNTFKSLANDLNLEKYTNMVLKLESDLEKIINKKQRVSFKESESEQEKEQGYESVTVHSSTEGKTKSKSTRKPEKKVSPKRPTAKRGKISTASKNKADLHRKQIDDLLKDTKNNNSQLLSINLIELNKVSSDYPKYVTPSEINEYEKKINDYENKFKSVEHSEPVEVQSEQTNIEKEADYIIIKNLKIEAANLIKKFENNKDDENDYNNLLVHLNLLEKYSKKYNDLNLDKAIDIILEFMTEAKEKRDSERKRLTYEYTIKESLNKINKKMISGKKIDNYDISEIESNINELKKILEKYNDAELREKISKFEDSLELILKSSFIEKEQESEAESSEEETHGGKIATIGFYKSDWTEKDANEWLKNHNFKKKKVHETKKMYKYRQIPPKKGDTYSSKKLDNNILLTFKY